MKDFEIRRQEKENKGKAGSYDKAQGEKDNFAYQLRLVFNKPEIEFILQLHHYQRLDVVHKLPRRFPWWPFVQAFLRESPFLSSILQAFLARELHRLSKERKDGLF